MLLCKFSSGHVKSSFDNIAKNFPVKTQVFFVKVQKKTKKPIAQEFFQWRFSCVHLDYCFDTPDYFFAKIRKNSIKVLKKMSLI